MDEVYKKHKISELEKIGNNYELADEIKDLCEDYSNYFKKIHHNQTVNYIKRQTSKTLSNIEKEIKSELYHYTNFMNKAIEFTFPHKNMKHLKFLLGDAIFESYDSIRAAHKYHND